MAQSPSHRFGQIIGHLLESAIFPALEAVAIEHRLYLDTKGVRKARANKRKVAWVDGKGNTHDLDYVLEQGGSDEHVGVPKAFVETAWRRYTKHSRSKAQEIQGAITPLAERYRDAHPFLGIVVAGVFTESSINQLRSLGFTVLYIPYESVIAAFATVGINAEFGEDTPDAALLREVKKYGRLTSTQRNQIETSLLLRNRGDLEAFISTLQASLSRKIEFVYILTLHGSRQTVGNLAEAIAYIESFDETKQAARFIRYDVGVRYSNGDDVRGQFNDKSSAISFLQTIR
jgi:hypothetical protein